MASPLFRVVWKFTHTTENSDATELRSKVVRDANSYIEQNEKSRLEERAKILKHSVEKDAKNPHLDRQGIDLPEIRGGLFASKALLKIKQQEFAPLHPQAKKEWVADMADTWMAQLNNPANKGRKYLRKNAVLSIDKGLEKDLLEINVLPEEFLRTIFRNGTQIVKKLQNLPEKSEIQYYGGIHYDKAHVHAHFRLFPFAIEEGAKKNSHIQTSSYVNSSNPEKYAQMHWIAAMNMAAEMWWREHMPLEKQRADVQYARLRNLPEPPIQGLDFYLSHAPGLKKFKPDLAKSLIQEIEEKETLLKLGTVNIPFEDPRKIEDAASIVQEEFEESLTEKEKEEFRESLEDPKIQNKHKTEFLWKFDDIQNRLEQSETRKNLIATALLIAQPVNIQEFNQTITATDKYEELYDKCSASVKLQLDLLYQRLSDRDREQLIHLTPRGKEILFENMNQVSKQTQYELKKEVTKLTRAQQYKTYQLSDIEKLQTKELFTDHAQKMKLDEQIEKIKKAINYQNQIVIIGEKEEQRRAALKEKTKKQKPLPEKNAKNRFINYKKEKLRKSNKSIDKKSI